MQNGTNSYYFSLDKPDWSTAMLECESREAKLAIITDEREANVLGNEIERRY